MPCSRALLARAAILSLTGAWAPVVNGCAGPPAGAATSFVTAAPASVARIEGNLVAIAGGVPAVLPHRAILLENEPLSFTSDGTFEAPLPAAPFSLALSAPGHVPVTLSGAAPGPVPGARWLLPLVPSNAAGPDEALVAGLVVDPRGLPLKRGVVTLTAAFLPGGAALRLHLDDHGAFVWRQALPTGSAVAEGPAMLSASGHSRGGWTVETTTVTQRLLRKGQADVVILQGQAAPLHRPPRWRWVPPVLSVQLEDTLSVPDEAWLVRAGNPARAVMAGAGPDGFTLRFELPAGEAFEPGGWRLNILGTEARLGAPLEALDAG